MAFSLLVLLMVEIVLLLIMSPSFSLLSGSIQSEQTLLKMFLQPEHLLLTMSARESAVRVGEGSPSSVDQNPY